MKVAYYGSKISPHMTKTPEGILVCHSVPIARTGEQKYLAKELGLEGDQQRVVLAIREPEEVFSDKAMASFEGKPVTDEHPPGLLDVNTINKYVKGFVKNVRRGKDTEADLLLADLVIYDQALIAEIEKGKREVSSGYSLTCIVAEDENTLWQRDICGNHVAIVHEGRAGHRVAIKDEKEERAMGIMETVRLKLARLFFADESITPEESSAAMQILGDDEMGTEEVMKLEKETEEVGQSMNENENQFAEQEQGGNDIASVLAALLEATKENTVLLRSLAAPPEEKSGLDELEEELSAEATDDDEESTTIEEEEKEEEKASMDSATRLGYLRTLKPVIAAIKDPKERKAASDAISALLRQPASNDTYGNIVAGLTASVQARDTVEDERAKGERWATERQAHLKRG